MSKLFITSDLHLGHKNILKFRNGFESQEAHDENLWRASGEVNGCEVEVWHENPLRAAAIVYLLMQEGE